jgi:alpha-L-rhamnosidase
MNSFAHYSFGAVYQWMVENIGGIHSAAPSYKQILIAPELDDKVSSASIAYRSIRGLIDTDWTVKDGKLLLNVTIPANTTAQVVLPAASADTVTESGHTLDKAAGVSFQRVEGQNVILSVGSGHYAFAMPRAR